MYDVAVLGTGLSGCLLAIKLKLMGRHILLIDKSSQQKNHIPETTYLSPNYVSSITNIPLSEINACFSTQSRVEFWSRDREETVTIVYSTEVERGPYLVDRAKLDDLLLTHAINLGCDTIFNADVTHIELSKHTQSIDCVVNNHTLSANCKVMVDATGKQAFLANKLNLKIEKTKLDDRLGVFSYFSNKEFHNTLSKNTLVITEIDSGYCFIVPLSGSTITVGLITDNYDKNESLGEIFLDKISGLEWLRQMVEKSERALPFLPVINESFKVSRPAGEGYFIIGEALGFSDPFFCNGIVIAAESAVLCAEAIISILESELRDLSITKYNTDIKTLYLEKPAQLHDQLKHRRPIIRKRSLADPHIPYSIACFMSGIASQKSSSIEALYELRQEYNDPQKGAGSCAIST